MRIHLPIFILVANLFFSALAWAAPELQVADGKHDFGTMPQGKKVQHSFKIKNVGDAPLQIKQVEADCGCTAAKPSSSVVAPGESAEIHVTFDSGNFSGKVHKNVMLSTNAGKMPNYTFKLEADITEAVQVAPRQLSVGSLAKGAAKQVSLTVTNRSESNLKLLEVKVNSNSLRIKPTINKAELKPGESGTVELSISPNTEAKVLSGYVHIVTNNPQKKEITIPVYGSAAK